jgi:hypothetical protein
VNLAPIFQTQLVLDTHKAVADTQTVAVDTKIAVTNTQSIVTDTQTMVADMHRNMLTGQKGISDQNDSVGATCYSQTTDYLRLPRLKPGQQYSLLWGP